jgi:hypothetical protein
LVKFHEWIRHKALKLVVLFEGRDAAGKGVYDQAHHPGDTISSPRFTPSQSSLCD